MNQFSNLFESPFLLHVFYFNMAHGGIYQKITVGNNMNTGTNVSQALPRLLTANLPNSLEVS
jgi:hypothetical protein